MIKDLKELQALLKLCRKQGVTEIKVGDVSVHFGELPTKAAGDKEDADESTPTDELTPEQLMFFSVGGAPKP